MYRIYALGEEKPNGHFFSGWGGISRTYESDLKEFLVFEDEEVITFIYGAYLRTPPVGRFEYAPYGDVDWSEWDDLENPQCWLAKALAAGKPASEMEDEFKELLYRGYTLYCNI